MGLAITLCYSTRRQRRKKKFLTAIVGIQEGPEFQSLLSAWHHAKLQKLENFSIYKLAYSRFILTKER